MFIGTLFGVLVIPGLYYIFGSMAEGRNLIKDEASEPFSEELMRTSEGESRTRAKLREITKLLKKLTKGKDDEK
jgi:HAE1 family hydrophobic/amphiphilic exporter-1